MIIQALILVLGAACQFLLCSQRRRWRLFGAYIGVLQQPLWFVTTYQASQWGVFILSFWFLYVYTMGIINNRSSHGLHQRPTLR